MKDPKSLSLRVGVALGIQHDWQRFIADHDACNR